MAQAGSSQIHRYKNHANPSYQANNIAFISNDRTHHRIALVAVPGLRDGPQKIVHTGIHHTAFEYDSFDDLMSSFARLKQTGIEPETCLNYGVAASLYYSDPDQNMVELQVDNFGNWEASAEWMRTSEAFRQNPIGTFFDPDRVLAAYKAGATFDQLQKDTYAGIYPPSKPPNLPPYFVETMKAERNLASLPTSAGQWRGSRWLGTFIDSYTTRPSGNSMDGT